MHKKNEPLIHLSVFVMSIDQGLRVFSRFQAVKYER